MVRRHDTDPTIAKAVAKLLAERDLPPRISSSGSGADSHTHPKESVPDILVASADARAEVKRMADYVCDGVDDQEEINAALAAAFYDTGSYAGFTDRGPEVVRRVLLSGGEFNISGTIDLNRFQEFGALHGVGPSTILRRQPGSAAFGASGMISVDWAELGNLSISGGDWGDYGYEAAISVDSYSYVHDITFRYFFRNQDWGSGSCDGIRSGGSSNRISNITFDGRIDSLTNKPPWGTASLAWWGPARCVFSAAESNSIYDNIVIECECEAGVVVTGAGSDQNKGVIVNNVTATVAGIGLLLTENAGLIVNNVAISNEGYSAWNKAVEDPDWPSGYGSLTDLIGGDPPPSAIVCVDGDHTTMLSNVWVRGFWGNGLFAADTFGQYHDLVARNLNFVGLGGAPVVLTGGGSDSFGSSIIGVDYTQCFDVLNTGTEDDYLRFVETGVKAGIVMIPSGFEGRYYPQPTYSNSGSSRWVIQDVYRRAQNSAGAGDWGDDAGDVDDHIVYIGEGWTNCHVSVYDTRGSDPSNGDLTLAVPVSDNGTGNRVFVNGVTERAVAYLDSSAPTTYQVGELWVDTSSSPPVLKYWDGTGWFPVAAVTSSEPFAASGSSSVSFGVSAVPSNQGVGETSLTAALAADGGVVGTTATATLTVGVSAVGNADRSETGSSVVSFAASGDGSVA